MFFHTALPPTRNLVATNSLGYLLLIVTVFLFQLLDELDILLLGLGGIAIGVLDGLLPGGLLCLALYRWKIHMIS